MTRNNSVPSKGQNKKSKKGIIILLGIVAVVIILGVINISGKNRGKAKEVQTVLVETTDLSQEVTANGEIGSRENSTVVSRINGTIKQLFVEVGDRVAAGEIIALIDEEQISVQQKSAIAALESTRRGVKGELLTLRSSYSQAKSNFEKAQRSYDSIKGSHNLGSASTEQLTEAEDTLRMAESNYKSALQQLNFREGRQINDTRVTPSPSDEEIIEASVEVKQSVANLNAINSNLKACEIRAAIEGIITDLSIESGSVVGAGMVIAKIHNPDLLEVTANIDEVDIGNIKLNQTVNIVSDSFLDRKLEGKVSFIAPLIRRIGESRVCQIRVAFSDPEKEAKVGAGCSIFITVKDLKGVPVIPIEAYLQEDGKKFSFKIVADEAKGKVLSKVEIETGLIGIDNVEVLSGLSVGDEVVTVDLKMLTDGIRVNPKRDKNDKVE